MRRLLYILLLAPLSFLLANSASACTDGVDCFCDLIPAIDGAVVFCEDFENTRLQEDWGWRGGGGSAPYGGWENQNYGGIVGSCGNDPDITNVDKCIDITTADTPSSTRMTAVASGDLVFDGTHALAQVNRPSALNNKTNGLHGVANFSNNAYVTDFGITHAIYYSTDIEGQGNAWKPEEFTPARWPIQGVTTGNCGGGWDVLPYSGTLWWAATSTVSFTPVVGQLCDQPVDGGSSGSKLKATPIIGTGANEYTYQDGIWRCRQVQYNGWGTENGRIRHWWDGELVIDVLVDMRQPRGGQTNPSSQGVRQFEWNNYWNGSGSPQGYKGNNPSGRIKDNYVITSNTEPVSCADIGFGGQSVSGSYPTGGEDGMCITGAGDCSNVDIRLDIDGSETGSVTWGIDCDNNGSYEVTASADEEFHTFTNACSFSGVGSKTVPIRATRNSVQADNTMVFTVNPALTKSVSVTIDPTTAVTPASTTITATANNYIGDGSDTTWVFECDGDDDWNDPCTLSGSDNEICDCDDNAPVGNNTVGARETQDDPDNQDTTTFIVTAGGTAPVISNPTNCCQNLPYFTIEASPTIDTDISATCKFDWDPGTAYAAQELYDTTGGTTHTDYFANLDPGQVVHLYTKCSDDAGVTVSDEYDLIISVDAVPTSSKVFGGSVTGGTIE